MRIYNLESETDIHGSALDLTWIKDPDLQAFMSLLEDTGEARLVGGGVRDCLMGQLLPDVDIDIATTHTPKETLSLAGKAGLKAIPTGIDHGTITVIVQGRPFEVTTLRRDVETDGRRAVVAFTQDFAEDAMRRDLTINAMSLSREVQLYDYFGGMDDLKAGRIRFVGDAGTRMDEDILRIIRFFRFAAKIPQSHMDEEAVSACIARKEKIRELSGERVWSEMVKFLSLPDPFESIGKMTEAGILSICLDLKGPDPQILEIIPDIEQISKVETRDPVLRLLGLLKNCDPEALEKIAQNWRMSRKVRTRLNSRAHWDDMAKIPLHEALYWYGKDAVADWMQIKHLSRWQDQKSVILGFEKPKLPITGKDIMDQNGLTGIEVGKMLRKLEKAWVASRFKMGSEDLMRQVSV